MTRPILLALLILATPAHAQTCPPPGLHFSPEENLERIDAALIGCARQRIDFAAYTLTSFAIIDALRKAAGRGVKVRIYADASTRALHRQALALARTPNIELRRKATTTLMHLKAYSVDGAHLRTGAANFSPGGLKRQDNDLLITTDPAALAGFAAKFETMWSR